MTLKLLTLTATLALASTASAGERVLSQEFGALVDNYGDPFELMHALEKSMQAHPQASRIHIRWGMAEPHGGNGGDFIYDRKRQIIFIEQESNYWDDGDERPLADVTERWQHWKFSRVTPKRLQLLFRKYSAPSKRQFIDRDYEVSFFPHLTEFGCRGGLLRRTIKQWKQKVVGDQWVIVGKVRSFHE